MFCWVRFGSLSSGAIKKMGLSTRFIFTGENVSRVFNGLTKYGNTVGVFRRFPAKENISQSNCKGDSHQ